MNTTPPFSRTVSLWLIIGLVMVFGQILIGGVTRLTGSGLSITKWEIVTGTLPPLSDDAWQEEFALYQSTPQYKLINRGMDMKEFKFIYFWEYFHRLWARLMGFVFLIPFLFFWWKGKLDWILIKRLLGLVLLAGLAASFGWIMVASGLVERPWVNAYKLSAHLLLGFSVFVVLWMIWLRYRFGESRITLPGVRRRWGWILLVALLVQIIFGGWMSGMKAGYSYPTWPDMNGVWIPDILVDKTAWTWGNIQAYDDSLFMPALVHVVHRNLAYLLIIIGLATFFMLRTTQKDKTFRLSHKLLIIMLITQIALGIFTVLGFQHGYPVALGSAHQMMGLLLLTCVVTLLARSRSVTGSEA